VPEHLDARQCPESTTLHVLARQLASGSVVDADAQFGIRELAA